MADNWAICPRCKQLVTAELAALKDLHYGTIPEQEYLNLVAKVEQVEETSCRTLGEHYEIGIQDNEFRISYRGACRVCGFSKTFDVKEPVRDKSGE